MKNDKITWEKVNADSIEFTKNNIDQAIKIIDGKFGKDFHKKHPEVVMSFLQVATSEYSAITIKNAVTELNHSIKEVRDEINSVANQIESIQ